MVGRIANESFPEERDDGRKQKKTETATADDAPFYAIRHRVIHLILFFSK